MYVSLGRSADITPVCHLFLPRSSSSYLNVAPAKQPNPTVNLQEVHALSNVREVQVLLQKVAGLAPAWVEPCSDGVPWKLARATSLACAVKYPKTQPPAETKRGARTNAATKSQSADLIN